MKSFLKFQALFFAVFLFSYSSALKVFQFLFYFYFFVFSHSFYFCDFLLRCLEFSWLPNRSEKHVRKIKITSAIPGCVAKLALQMEIPDSDAPEFNHSSQLLRFLLYLHFELVFFLFRFKFLFIFIYFF